MQNKECILDIGNLMFDFSDIDNWIVTNGIKEIDTEHTSIGNSSIKITSTVAGGQTILEKSISNYKANKNFYLKFYCDNVSAINYITVYFTSVSNWSKYLYMHFIDNLSLKNGWNTIHYTLDNCTLYEGELKTNTFIKYKIKITSKTNKYASVTLDSFYEKFEAISSTLITIDDARKSVYDLAYPYFLKVNNKVANLKATLYINSAFVNTTDYMTDEQIQEVFTAGWDICNHTHSHLDLSTLSREQIKEEILQCEEYISSHNWDRGTKNLAIPFGNFNDTVLDVLNELGYTTARNSYTGLIFYPAKKTHLTLTTTGHNTTTLNEMIVNTNKAIQYKATEITIFHLFSNSPASTYEININVFKSWIDYLLATKQKVLTINEFIDMTKYNKV